MPLTRHHASFPYPAPTPQQLADQITRLTSLDVTVTPSPPEILAPLYDTHATVAFTAQPAITLRLYTYRPGAVREQQRLNGTDNMPFSQIVEGINEPPNTQALYLESLAGEYTLFHAAVLALDALGGQPSRPIPDTLRQRFAQPLTTVQLRRRYRNASLRGTLGCLLMVLLLPFWLPIMFLQCIAHLITFSLRTRRILHQTGQFARGEKIRNSNLP